MNNRLDELTCAATFVILATALIDPYLSAALALVLLVGFALYSVFWTRKPPIKH